MNLKELLERSSPEDRQKIIDHFVLWLQGKDGGEALILRQTAKLSTLSSEEDLKKQVSTIFGVPIEKFANFNFKESIHSINSQFDEVQQLITPYQDYLMSLKAKEDKFEELNDIGKFLVSLEIPCSITIPVKAVPYPDFIIESNKKTIGIEHTRLLSETSQRFIKNIRHVLKIAEDTLRKKDEHFTQIINLRFNYQAEVLNRKTLTNTTLTKDEKESIAKIISDWIYSRLINLSPAKPSFIDKVEVIVDSIHPLSLNLVESYLGKTEVENLLGKRLESKEKKVSRYSSVSGLDEVWLIIIVNGVSTASSFVIEEAELKNKIASSFDKVYLFDAFSNSVFHLLG
jgi:hypothetical protein